MFLILDQYLTEFNLRLKRVTERKEMKTLLLTSAQIALDLALVFRLSEQDASICNIRTQPSKPSISMASIAELTPSNLGYGDNSPLILQ